MSKIIIMKPEEIDLNELAERIAVSFRQKEDDKRFGYATVTLKHPLGNINIRLTVWRSKFAETLGEPRIFWTSTSDGYTTSPYMRNGYKHPRESSFDIQLKNLIDAVVTAKVNEVCAAGEYTPAKPESTSQVDLSEGHEEVEETAPEKTELSQEDQKKF